MTQLLTCLTLTARSTKLSYRDSRLPPRFVAAASYSRMYSDAHLTEPPNIFNTLCCIGRAQGGPLLSFRLVGPINKPNARPCKRSTKLPRGLLGENRIVARDRIRRIACAGLTHVASGSREPHPHVIGVVHWIATLR